MFHGILRKKTDARVCSYKKEAYVSVLQFLAPPNVKRKIMFRR